MPTTLLKETPLQVFSCEIYKVFPNTFFHRTPPVAASEFYFGEEQIYINTLVLNILRVDLMRTFKSRQQAENKKKIDTLLMYIYNLYCSFLEGVARYFGILFFFVPLWICKFKDFLMSVYVSNIKCVIGLLASFLH